MKSLLQYVFPAILFVTVLGLSVGKSEAECTTPESFQTQVSNLSTDSTSFEFDVHLKSWQTSAFPYAGFMVGVNATGNAFVQTGTVAANPDWTNFSATTCTATGQDIYLFTVTGLYPTMGECPGGGGNVNLDIRLYRDIGYIEQVQACNVGCPQ